MAAAAAKTSRTEPSADSYIGSLISLTSKSEIRYEGVLFNINTEESSIGLRNVRSFGTEGRKKDGQQIPPSDKIYEYILFRGSDIKDLQVKSSPPVQTAAPIHNDPAIIQSHYSRPAAPASLPATLPSVGSGAVADITSHPAQVGAPRATFQSGLPLYQPGGSMASWGSSPPTAMNGQGLAMPMYWQGFYAPAGGMPPPGGLAHGPTGGLPPAGGLAHPSAGGLPPPPSGGMPHLQQPPLLRPPGPPPGLPIPHSMQQPLQYPGINHLLSSSSQTPGANASLLPGLPNLPGQEATSLSASLSGTNLSPVPSNLSGISASLPSVPSLLPGMSVPPLSGSTNLPGSNILLPPGSLTLPDIPPLLSAVGSNLASATLPSSTQTTSTSPDATLSLLSGKPPVTSLPSTVSHDLPIASGLESTLESASGNSKGTSGKDAAQQIASSVTSVPGSSYSSLPDTSTPLLFTPGQILQSGSSNVASAQLLQTSNKTAEVRPVPSETQEQAPIETKEPILPLPRPSDQKKNGAPMHAHHINRGRGRGRGHMFSRTAMRFTEDFDFTAMNEKFNKDEVWGHLGRGRDKEGNAVEDEADEIVFEGGDSEEHPKPDVKPVYVKDDFFDSLSSNSLGGGSRNGRVRFSEQMKIDTETFGDFPRHRPGRGGGRGFRGGGGGGGRSRGSYGRAYGFSGRGQAPRNNMPNN
ncbi:unnamed protein product [Spirodela intermedia]|uniref:Uncharacterized protein n=1 Tax=Spirodela intermedia TaxID=51605 RepID=A0A7I8LJW6_SPIIN|nr:unnamed protein product [Spirodela intermedia]